MITWDHVKMYILIQYIWDGVCNSKFLTSSGYLQRASYPFMLLVHDAYRPYVWVIWLEKLKNTHLRACSTYSYNNMKPILLYLTSKMTIHSSHAEMDLCLHSWSQVAHVVRFGHQAIVICQKGRLVH